MKKILYKISWVTFAIITILISGCELYPDYDVEYSPAYPVCGDYYVRDYVQDSVSFQYAKSGYHNIFIYSTSFEPEKYVWINNMQDTKNTFVVKSEYSLSNLSFDGTNLPHSPKSATPPANPDKVVTIEISKIFRNDWPTPDSIVFRATIVKDTVTNVVIYAGHRFKGTEKPYWDNHNGK